ncbi:uncharacterized protein LOC116842702 [Odontomachus brunneus]|uniref:uncharacterized protein LOC116842702 n=1 Tax=Odontomachus brunneus TaxID=486640 RepID=UPI0013F1DF9B|nr:uncharacterized protein LOC116842702 [Odontomachus brunneus]
MKIEGQREKKNMDFRNLNPLNIRANLLSGNLLPITPDDSRPSILWRAYGVIILLIEVIQIAGFIFGLILAPQKKTLKEGSIGVMVTIEVIVMLTRFYAHKKLLKRVIGKLNDLLRDADETMKDIVRSILKPKIMPLTLYGIFSVISFLVWNIEPLLLVFNRNTFFYSDYNVPTAFSAEPFSTSVLIPSILIMAFGGSSRILKKYSLDVYMMHLVLLLTAQYRYMAIKLAQLFRHPRETGGGRSEEDRWVEELRTLCQHYNTVIW